MSIIIPLLNEGETIAELLNQLFGLNYPTFVEKYEILIVDNGSDDGSGEVAALFAKKHPNFKFIHENSTRGKGASVRKGIQSAMGDIILVCDADLELEVDDIPKLLTTMDERSLDFVNGSRIFLGKNQIPANLFRIIANKVFSLLATMITKVKINDVACGYKVFKKQHAETLRLEENGFGFEAELMIKFLLHIRGAFAEVPVKYLPRSAKKGKKLRITDGIRILFVILKYGLLKR